MRQEREPLLSVCVPTYNSANLLRVMLEALLPQVEQTCGRVEVWVSDNASDDETTEVVKAARQHGPVNYWRHQTNTGPLNNLISSACELAQGEYVWVLASHNLMMPGALKKVLAVLEDNAHLDLFYANFRCASYPYQWPTSAVGGYSGEFSYLANDEINDRRIEHWHELIRGSSALCTQSYAHIVRRSIWREFWDDKYLKESFVNAATTYPHTYMLAKTSFNKRSHYIGWPSITIYNGAQTWGATLTRSHVYLLGLPDLIKLFVRCGLPSAQLIEARAFNKAQLHKISLLFFTGEFGAKQKLLFICRLFRSPRLIGPFWHGFLDSEAGLFSRSIKKMCHLLQGFYRYSFYQCRPARWFWSKYHS